MICLIRYLNVYGQNATIRYIKKCILHITISMEPRSTNISILFFSTHKSHSNRKFNGAMADNKIQYIFYNSSLNLQNRIGPLFITTI